MYLSQSVKFSMLEGGESFKVKHIHVVVGHLVPVSAKDDEAVSEHNATVPISSLRSLARNDTCYMRYFWL
jgi:hypothetical protein